MPVRKLSHSVWESGFTWQRKTFGSLFVWHASISKRIFDTYYRKI